MENEDFIVWIRKSQLKIEEIWWRKPAAGEKKIGTAEGRRIFLKGFLNEEKFPRSTLRKTNLVEKKKL